MQVERPNYKPLTEVDLLQLDKLEALLQKAIADGVITRDELDAIKVQVYADGKVIIEELDLVRQYIQEKVRSGELTIEFFG